MSEDVKEIKEVKPPKPCVLDHIPRMMFKLVDKHTLVCEVCGEDVAEQDEGLIAKLLSQESFKEINSVSILMTRYARVRGKELPPHCFSDCEILKAFKLADSIIKEVCKKRGVSLDALKDIADMKDNLEVEYVALVAGCEGLDEDIKIKSVWVNVLTDKADELCKMLNIDA